MMARLAVLVSIGGLLVTADTSGPPQPPKVFVVPFPEADARVACFLAATNATSVFTERGKGMDHALAEAWFQRAIRGTHSLTRKMRLDVGAAGE